MKPYLLLLLSGSAAFAGVLPSVGPDYQRPEIKSPDAYRDAAGDAALWRTAKPADDWARGEWWSAFHDATLDQLERDALAANLDLQAAAARVEQARAIAGISRANYWPQISASPSLTRERTSRTTENVQPDTLTTTYRAPLEANWELDLFGRVRRLSERARADAAASAATFESVRLALTADVAVNYFSLRALDRERAIVESTVALRRKALDLVTARVRSGSAADLDAARAENELASTEVEASVLANERAKLQNALALLVGRPASAFDLAADANAVAVTPPAVPAGLPSQLLERRPDIAAAERTLAGANARIGVAKAAFFPAISLTGSAGYASGDIDRLFNSDSRLWSIGPSVYLPIFQGGRNRANLARSRAAFEEAVAVYRQRVLVAFREVQDAISATRYLNEQAVAQERALVSAQRAVTLAQRRYDAGFVSYLEVIDTQRTSLANERASVQLAAQRLNASVALIKALGGGWTSGGQQVAGNL